MGVSCLRVVFLIMNFNFSSAKYYKNRELY
jgi:hypothetical protein